MLFFSKSSKRIFCLKKKIWIFFGIEKKILTLRAQKRVSPFWLTFLGIILNEEVFITKPVNNNSNNNFRGNSNNNNRTTGSGGSNFGGNRSGGYQRNNRNYGAKAEEPYRINERIRANEVRLVGDNIETKVYSLDAALKIAHEQGLDLVEIAPNAVPPVCRVVDYSKFKYDQKKKQKELKAKSAKVVVKEIRFGPNTDEHDFQFKLRHAITFLKEGHKVKAFVNFVGRTILFKERGIEILERFIKELDEHGKLESEAKMEGKKMIIMLAPKKASKEKDEKEE
jgi:translation initiation factor IF-3